MLTPTFQITQTDELLILIIQAPYSRLTDVEINVLDSQFWFYSSPYFLRLFFPCKLVDDDEPATSFNADKGEFEIRLQKQEVGETCPDIDLLSTLLVPRKQRDQNIKPSIEVLSEGVEGEEDDEDDLEDWIFHQELPSNKPSPELQGLFAKPRYGFGNLTSGVFEQVKSEFKEIIELPEPDTNTVEQRDELRIAAENKSFSCNHYLADLMEPEVVKEYLDYKPPWHAETFSSVKLTEEERKSLKKMGNKEFLLEKEDKAAAWLSLVDIVFAFAYDQRSTQGESTVESAWTINKLSATLSWLCRYKSLHSVVITCYRRLLIYPLYRNWDLAQMVLKDTISILKLGRRQVLKCMLQIHSLFSYSEPRYLLNKLYITDYCIWLQKTSEHKFVKLAEVLEQVNISKSELGFDLEELEHAAMLIVQEEEEDELPVKVSSLSLKGNKGNEYTSSSSCETSSSDSSEDSSSLDSDDESSSKS